MKHIPANDTRCLLLTVIVFILLIHTTSLHAATHPPSDLSKTEIIRLGEQMYLHGLLPSGRPMEAFIRGDVEVDSTAFSCSSCHLRSGLGSYEGGVVTPPTNGAKLYKPYKRSPSLGDAADRSSRSIYAKTILERPPYSRKTLSTALRFGTDPAGQVFNNVMPRYPLSEADMDVMVRYLELLSSEKSPGASNSDYKFATIITDDVNARDRAAMLGPLQRFIDGMNQQYAMFKAFIDFRYTATNDMKYAFHQASLSVWELKGSPDTWRAQLEAYYSKEPVFAILGGISNQPWEPMHQFCEEQRLPCLFPVTGLPVVSGNGWYTYYFNKGYYQEGEAAAHYLNRDEGLTESVRILQVVQESPVGQALADGFTAAWRQMDRRPVTTLTMTTWQLRERGALLQSIQQHAPDILLLWSDEIHGADLSTLVSSLSAKSRVFVSSSYLGVQTAAIPETARSAVFITYPYRLTPYVGTKLGFDAKVPIRATFERFGDSRISTRTETMLRQTVLNGLRQLEDNLYRDYLLDMLSMQMDQIVLDYERFSFGPGQRYASKGCYIIQLGPGSAPSLIPRSEWVMH